MKRFSPFLALIGCTAFCGVAHADALAAPGVYFSNTDNTSNSGFTVVTGNNIEIGLSAIDRFIGPITPTGDIYDVALGDASGHSGSIWGFTFSINLRAGGGSLSLSDVTAGLTLQDVVNGTTSAVPLDLKGIGDNGELAANETNGTCNDITKIGGSKCPVAPTDPYGLQNSETLSFSTIAGPLGDSGFNDAINDTYFFTLAVNSVTGSPLGTDTIEVIAGTGAPTSTPEPITLSIFGAGLVGAAAMRRRKAKRA